MSYEDCNYIMIFTSHHRALYIYERLLRKKIKVKLVSAPNLINISCTQAVKFREEDIEIVKKEVRKDNIFPTAVYKIMKDGRKETYELVE